MSSKILTYWIFHWPVWKSQCITKMLEVINITEQFIFQLWIVDNWDRTVLVECPCIALKARSEISKMSSNLLYHKTPESYKAKHSPQNMVTAEVHSTTSNRKISPSCMPTYRRDHCPILSWSYWKISQNDIFPPSISLSNTLKIYCNIRVDSPRQVVVVNEHKCNAAYRGSVFSTHERNSSTTQMSNTVRCSLKKIPFFLPISLPVIFDRSTGRCPCRSKKRHAVQT